MRFRAFCLQKRVVKRTSLLTPNECDDLEKPLLIGSFLVTALLRGCSVFTFVRSVIVAAVYFIPASCNKAVRTDIGRRAACTF